MSTFDDFAGVCTGAESVSIISRHSKLQSDSVVKRFLKFCHHIFDLLDSQAGRTAPASFKRIARMLWSFSTIVLNDYAQPALDPGNDVIDGPLINTS